MGNTVSDSAGTATVPQLWDIQWPGQRHLGHRHRAYDVPVREGGTAENATWYTITGDASAGGVGVRQHAVTRPLMAGHHQRILLPVDGVSSILSQSDDFAHVHDPLRPVTGFGNTVSSAYGTACAHSTPSAETEGMFDVDQQTTDSVTGAPDGARRLHRRAAVAELGATLRSMPIVTSVRADIAQPANAIAWQIDKSGDGHSWTPTNAGASGAAARGLRGCRRCTASSGSSTVARP